MTPLPTLTYRKDKRAFVFTCRFEERQLARQAGFVFTKDSPFWHTRNPGVAARLGEYADATAKTKINQFALTVSAWHSPLTYPESLTPYPFQIDAARFSLSRNHSYLAAEPGLGKTIMAALIRNATLAPTVYFTPPFLAMNVEQEFHKWCVGNPRIIRLDSKTPPSPDADILIVPDSIHHRENIRARVFTLLIGARAKKKAPLLIVDEAHRFKTSSSRRSKSLFEFFPHFPKKVFMSGTPMLNRPMELHSILSRAAPSTIDFMSKDEYGRHFCGGHFDGYKWDYSGATHLDELQSRIVGTFMHRIDKRDVLPELPPKTESIVLIGSASPKILALEKQILKTHSPVDLANRELQADSLAEYRRLLGEAKAAHAVEFIEDILLENQDEALVVFAYHRDVIARLEKALETFQPFVITGDTPKKDRQSMVDEFQKGGKRRLFIGNYQACGVGFTLTRSNRVLFVEPSWVDAENRQASDRCHRIGTRDNVLVQYLVYENSLDRTILETCLHKRALNKYI